MEKIKKAKCSPCVCCGEPSDCELRLLNPTRYERVTFPFCSRCVENEFYNKRIFEVVKEVDP